MANNQLPLPYDEALITDGQCKRYSADSKRWKKDEYYYAHLFDDLENENQSQSEQACHYGEWGGCRNLRVYFADKRHLSNDVRII